MALSLYNLSCWWDVKNKHNNNTMLMKVMLMIIGGDNDDDDNDIMQIMFTVVDLGLVTC